jgi:hypothetical protein
LLAFDVYSSQPTQTFTLYTGTAACQGGAYGEVWLSDFAVPPVATWTTQCVRFGVSGTPDRVGIIPTSPDTLVQRLRFVSSCDCTRAVKPYTSCGLDPGGHGGGSACE